MTGRPRKAPKRRRHADPNAAPFSSFLERDANRENRRRRGRRIFVISVGVHLVALLLVLGYSFVQVDELFAPSVGVRMFSPHSAPAGVLPAQPAVVIPAVPETPGQ